MVLADADLVLMPGPPPRVEAGYLDSAAPRRPAGSGRVRSRVAGSHKVPISFEDLTVELSAPLRRYFVRLVGDHATAEDLLQDTLLKIPRALPRFEGRSSVKTWAFSIATLVATDHFRRPESRAPLLSLSQPKGTD